ncbi:FBPase [Fragilaria crotonensis]|nr:FBPase [Fragilaria crotonensis]
MSETFESDTKTLNRFVMASTRDHELVILMNAIATSCKLITSAVQRAGIARLYGLAGEVNSTGDDQKKLDVLSNDMMINALVNSGVCSVLVSEENEEPIMVPPEKRGKYCVAFDPLDGSSNIDCNVSVGTIFSVYARKEGSEGTVDDLLRSGADCVCAGYVAYSSAVEMVFTFKNQAVHGFCLDPTIGEFVHTHIHRTILYGGIYLYPADNKSPKGKLRLLYEGIPMAMIIEQAGGIASTGLFQGKIQRVLDLVPTQIHDKCPIIMGGKRDVQLVYDSYKKAGEANVPDL